MTMTGITEKNYNNALVKKILAAKRNIEKHSATGNHDKNIYGIVPCNFAFILGNIISLFN